jgi:hypothetical protein
MATVSSNAAIPTAVEVSFTFGVSNISGVLLLLVSLILLSPLLLFVTPHVFKHP